MPPILSLFFLPLGIYLVRAALIVRVGTSTAMAQAALGIGTGFALTTGPACVRILDHVGWHDLLFVFVIGGWLPVAGLVLTVRATAATLRLAGMRPPRLTPFRLGALAIGVTIAVLVAIGGLTFDPPPWPARSGVRTPSPNLSFSDPVQGALQATGVLALSAGIGIVPQLVSTAARTNTVRSVTAWTLAMLLLHSLVLWVAEGSAAYPFVSGITAACVPLATLWLGMEPRHPARSP